MSNPLVERLKSRKLWLAVVASAVATLFMQLGVDIDTGFIAPPAGPTAQVVFHSSHTEAHPCYLVSVNGDMIEGDQFQKLLIILNHDEEVRAAIARAMTVPGPQ